jgi:hypothetical protein
MTGAAQRRATKRYRERRRKRGLKRLEVQVPASEAEVIRRAAEVLRNQAEEANRLRAHLGFELQPGRLSSALDIFAMKEPLDARTEALWDEAMTQVERARSDKSFNRSRDLDL